jgi:hypothetical protein
VTRSKSVAVIFRKFLYLISRRSFITVTFFAKVPYFDAAGYVKITNYRAVPCHVPEFNSKYKYEDNRMAKGCSHATKESAAHKGLSAKVLKRANGRNRLNYTC